MTMIKDSIKNSYFITEQDPDSIDFTEWRVLPGFPKCKPYNRYEICFTTLNKAWPVEFSVWMNHRFILVSPECPEAYFVDPEPILKICDEIREKDWEDFTGILNRVGESNFFFERYKSNIYVTD